LHHGARHRRRHEAVAAAPAAASESLPRSSSPLNCSQTARVQLNFGAPPTEETIGAAGQKAAEFNGQRERMIFAAAAGRVRSAPPACCSSPRLASRRALRGPACVAAAAGKLTDRRAHSFVRAAVEVKRTCCFARPPRRLAAAGLISLRRRRRRNNKAASAGLHSKPSSCGRAGRPPPLPLQPAWPRHLSAERANAHFKSAAAAAVDRQQVSRCRARDDRRLHSNRATGSGRPAAGRV
jgi:hypothetical protein